MLLKESLLNQNEYSVIGYKIGNTLTENGAVKRGVCFEENGVLKELIESEVKYEQNKIIAKPLDGRDEYYVTEDHPVSMLMYGIQTPLIDFLKEDIKKFFEKNKADLSTCEYYLPNVLNDYCKSSGIDIKLIPTTAKWMGITYSTDLEKLKDHINNEIKNGIYPNNLYE